MMTWHWHTEPPAVGIFLGLALAYYLCVGPLRKRLAPDAPFPRTQVLYFALGFIILALALLSPLDEMGERFLFSAHMLQHIILMYVVPIFLLAGVPGWLADFLLRKSRLQSPAHFLTRPIMALVIFNLVMYFWHFPVFYEAALHDHGIHILEHVTLLAASLIMWWPILSPTRLVPRAPFGGQLLYIFLLSVLQLPIVGFLVFSPEPFYATYIEAPRLFNLTPLADQQLGGVLMSVVGMIVLTGAFTAVFFRWYYESEVRPRQIRQAARLRRLEN